LAVPVEINVNSIHHGGRRGHGGKAIKNAFDFLRVLRGSRFFEFVLIRTTA
jgi:hypothetical protein